uniref:Protein C10 n=1 Tax=Strigamia maritima TaxID=126957 RepID=T1IJ18_STRMM
MSKLDSAKTTAGNDMIKIMQTVFPLVTQIQMEVIQAFGFTADGEGAIQFAQAIRAYEKDDPEIAKLNAEVRAYFIPQMAPQLPTPLSPTSAS